MKNLVLIIAGSLSLALGVIGIFVPLLPTTPFLLLSAACYLRSSRRLYLWLTNHRLFGNYIKGYLEFRAISLRTKAFTIAVLWLCILSTIFFFIDPLWLKVLLLVIAVSVTAHVLLLRTLTEEMLVAIRSREVPEE